MHGTGVKVAAAVMAAVIVGCGNQDGVKRVPLTGIVAAESLPESLNGTISFLPVGATKGPAANGLISDGQYRFSKEFGPVAGRHRVIVDVEPPRDKMEASSSKQGTPRRFEYEVTVPSEFPYELDITITDTKTAKKQQIEM